MHGGLLLRRGRLQRLPRSSRPADLSRSTLLRCPRRLWRTLQTSTSARGARRTPPPPSAQAPCTRHPVAPCCLRRTRTAPPGRAGLRGTPRSRNPRPTRPGSRAPCCRRALGAPAAARTRPRAAPGRPGRHTRRREPARLRRTGRCTLPSRQSACRWRWRGCEERCRLRAGRLVPGGWAGGGAGRAVRRGATAV
jgi:hypothetical protein